MRGRRGRAKLIGGEVNFVPEDIQVAARVDAIFSVE
jgi:hypothetical protein